MTPFAFVILALATHRVTHLATAERFAQRGLVRLRPLATRRFEGRRPVTGEYEGERFVNDPRKPLVWRVLYGLLGSHWTVGLGAGGLSVALWAAQHGWFQWVAYALASSSVSGLIHDLARRLK